MGDKLGVGKSLAFSHVGVGGATSPINNLQEVRCAPEVELEEFRQGTSDVDSHWSGSRSAEIEVQISDIDAFADFEVGQRYTNVALTFEAAKTSVGQAAGAEYVATLNRAVVSEIGEISRDNANKAPSVFSVTFRLSDHLDGIKPEYKMQKV